MEVTKNPVRWPECCGYDNKTKQNKDAAGIQITAPKNQRKQGTWMILLLQCLKNFRNPDLHNTQLLGQHLGI